jgi:hypothetical protein
MKDVIHRKKNTFNPLYQVFLAPPHQTSLSSARFVMGQLEPKENCDIKAMEFAVHFKNIRQSAQGTLRL